MYIDSSKAYTPSFLGEVRQIVSDQIWQDLNRDMDVMTIALVQAGATSERLGQKFRLPPLATLKAGSNQADRRIWLTVAEHQRCFQINLESWDEGTSTFVFIDKSAGDLDPSVVGELRRLTLETADQEASR